MPVPDPEPYQESCTQYNALKLNAELFGRAPHAELADTFERKLLNGVMGIQRPHKPGVVHVHVHMRVHVRVRVHVHVRSVVGIQRPHKPGALLHLMQHDATPWVAGCKPVHRGPRPTRPSTQL